MQTNIRPPSDSYIGGSDAAALMGAGFGGRSAMDLWLDKTGITNDPPPEGEQIRWGLLLEDFVSTEFARTQNVEVEKAKFTTLADYPYVGGHPDFHVMPANSKRVLETKTSRSQMWDNGIPMHVYWQCQHYNLITGADQCDVMVARLNLCEFDHYVVEANFWEHEDMLKKYEKFWKSVETKIPPPPESPRDIELLYTEPMEGEVSSTAEQEDWVKELEECKRLLAPLEVQRKDLEERIKFSLGSNQKVKLEQNGSITWRPVKSSRFDATSFKKENPELHAKYITQTTYRRFQIHRRKNV